MIIEIFIVWLIIIIIDYFIQLNLKRVVVNLRTLRFPKVKVSTYSGHSHSGFTCDPYRITDWVWSGIASIPWVGCVSNVFGYLWG
jgi:hypothetical protein